VVLASLVCWFAGLLVFGAIDSFQRMENFAETDLGAIGRTHF